MLRRLIERCLFLCYWSNLPLHKPQYSHLRSDFHFSLQLVSHSEFNIRGGHAWAVPYPGLIKWISASADQADMHILTVDVWRAGALIASWNVGTFLVPIPPSASAGLYPNDYDFAVYETSGLLAVISGDEIRVEARNGNLTADVNIAACVGVNWTSNTGTSTVQSDGVAYVPK